MKQRFLLLVSLICLSSLMNLWAVPAYPGWQDIEQPDGSIIELRLVGDEFYHFWMNRDGQEVIQNDEGWWVVKPEQLSTAQRKARRATSPMYKEEMTLRRTALKPTKLLVILVNFKDVKMQADHDNLYFDEVLNGENHEPYGSVREYFQTTSDGKYNPHWDVWGPVTLDSAMAYYGRNTTATGGSDAHPREMAYEACKKADALGCDFTQYDSDNNGYVDNVYIIYAGYSEAICGSKTDYIWPHAWGMKESWAKIDGKTLYRYGCSAELSGCSGTDVAGIGTFCHEFSHVIGMPDYYDTGYGYNYKNDMTPGKWSLMDEGSHNSNGQQPPLYSIFDKVYMGWATMPDLLPKESAQNVTMPVGSQYATYITGGTTAKKYTSSDTIYYLENRQKTGNYDGGLPYSGMLIWRVTYTKDDWDNVNSTEKVLKYTLVSATGLETGIGTKKDPYPGTNSVTSKNLLPGCQLSDITLSNRVITFKYNGGTDESYTHTWIAKGSTYKTSTSSSMLIFPNTNPSACSSTNTFYGWTEQTSVQKNGYGLVLAKNYSTVSTNKTFYAVYRSTTQPYTYSFLCSNSTVGTSTVNEVYADGMRFNWHGRIFTQPGTYYDTVRTINGDSIITLNLSTVHPRMSISYNAQDKLPEVTEPQAAGLHTNAFGQSIVCHSFSEGKGTIAFADTVRMIGDYAFYSCTEMDSITIPKRVTSIGDRAFYNCSALKYVKLNNSAVTSIGDAAFYKCKNMTAISLPPAITRIGDRTFYYCSSLTSLSIPTGVTTIDKYALGKCWGLKSLNLPESVTTLGDSALYNCRNLTKIKSYNITPPTCGENSFAEVPNTIPVYVWASAQEDYEEDTKWQYFSDIRTFDCGDPATRDTTRAVVAAGNSYAFRDRTYTESGIYMDTTMDAYGCDTNIYRLELVVLDSAKVIMYKANNKLHETGEDGGLGLHTKSTTFGQAIAVHTYIDSIGYIAFRDTLTTIGYRAFYGCNGNTEPLRGITIPKMVKTIGEGAFYANFQLPYVELPDSVTSLGNKAFHNCTGLSSIVSKALTPPTCDAASFNQVPTTVPVYVWPIAQAAYQEANVWKGFDSIYRISCDHPAQIQPVYNTICDGESFEWFGKQYTETGEYDTLTMNQYGCDTTGYRLYLTVTPRYNFDTAAVFTPGQSYNWRGRSITESGFYYDSLRTHDGCDSVYAFYLADSTRAIVYGAPAKLAEVTGGTETLGLHTAAFDQPIVAHTFANGEGIIVFGDTLKQIGNYAFNGCRKGYSEMNTITIPQTVTSLGDRSFYYCCDLESIEIPEGVTSIGERAFRKCTTMVAITCKALVLPSCGENCFQDMTLENVTLNVWPIKYKAYDETSPWSGFDVQKINCDHPYQMITTYDTICQGETYTWRGKEYTTTVTRRDTVTNKYGCDSVCYRLKLQVNPTYLIESSATIVESQTYNWRDTILTTSGVYYDSLKTKLGCDSVYKLTLSVIPAERVIIYEATNQLIEITSKAKSSSVGLHTYNFGQPMVSHTFDEGTKKGYITFANPLTQIGDSAFYGCRSGGGGELKAVTLPNTITSIGKCAFNNCRQLKSLTIPEGVKSIGNRGIFRCESLTSITCEALTPPTCGTECCSLSNPTKIYVWPIALASYKAASYWKDYKNIITKITCDQPERNDLTRDTICQGDSLLWLGKYYKVSTTKDSLYMNKYGCDTVRYRLELTVGEKYLFEENATWVNGMTYTWHGRNLTTGGVYWDSLTTKLGCDSVYKLTLNFTDSTRAIIYTAANKLKEVSTSKTTDYGLHTHVFEQPIISHAFANGVGVVAFHNPLTLIGDSAFYACNTNSEPLTGIILPRTIQSIKECAFFACQQLEYLDIPDAVTSIEQLAFHGCRKLTTLTIPEGIDVLYYRAINNCVGLKTLYLPESLDSLGKEALRQDSNLVSITCKSLTPPRCGVNCFDAMKIDKEPKKILYVWPSALNAYKADENWNKFNVQPLDCENIPDVDSTYATICPSEKYIWREKEYTAEGTYSDTLKNKYGCDSAVHRLILTHYPNYEVPEAATFVKGLTYVWHGKNLTEAGTYYDTLSSIHGCDSVIALKLTMTDSTKAIIYTAPKKLVETPISIFGVHLGLRVNAFGQPIISHSFSNGTGVLAFANDLTQVGDTAFYGCRHNIKGVQVDGLEVNTITLPSTVTSIGGYAFYCCWDLTELNIPSGVTSIGSAAFNRCEKLSSIQLPEGITDLNYHVLYQCYALTSLTIPASVDSLGKEAIAGCTGLQSLRVETIHPPKCGKNCFLGITTTIPVSVWPIGFTEYQNDTKWQYFTTFQKIACDQPLSRDTTRAAICQGDSYEWLGKQYSKAGNYDSTTVNEFGCDTVVRRLELAVNPTYLFEESDTIVDGMIYEWHGQQLTKTGVYYDSLKTTLGCDSVYQLSLTNISSKKAIWYKAPQKLAVVTEDDALGVHSTAFNRTITAHYYRGRTGIIIFNGVMTRVGNRAFYGCTSSNNYEVDTIHIPITTDTIGDGAFYNCQNLKVVNIPSTVDTIGENAFYRCRALTSVTLPEGIKNINFRMFYECRALTELVLPQSVTTINRLAMYDCRNLTSITIPQNVTLIRDSAFQGCTKLESITALPLTPPECRQKCFDKVDKTIPLYVYPISMPAYQTANGWKDFFIQPNCPDPIVADTTKASVCEGSTYEWHGKQYTIAGTYSDTLKNIYGCDSAACCLELTLNPKYLFEETATFVTGMTYVWRGKNLTTAGVHYDSLTTKLGCDSVYQLTLTLVDANKAVIYTANHQLPEVTGLGYGLHTGDFNSALQSHTFSNGTGVVVFASDVTRVGDRAFYGCNATSGHEVYSVTLPNTVTTIGVSAFYGCALMTSVNIPNSVTSFGDSTFVRCSALTTINIPEGVTTLGTRMFYYCTGLQTLTIPSTVTSLAVQALRNCTGLTSLVVRAQNPPSVGGTVCFENVDSTILRVYPASLEAYQKHDKWKYFKPIQPFYNTLTLSELDLNTSKIVADTYDTIRLERTLYNDRYNTFCVPFAVELDSMVRYFGENYKLYKLASSETSSSSITINFDEVTTDGIVAGKPYLMEVEKNVVNPTFTNRTITVTTPDYDVAGSGSVIYQGVYCQTLLHRNSSPKEYFLASNNLLYRPVVDENMKGLRCYFKIDNPSGAPIRMNINEPSTPTKLEVHNAQCTMHNGKFIQDNQLIIIRDGKMYNAQGQLMKP